MTNPTPRDSAQLPPHSLPAPSTWSMVGAYPIKAHTDMAVRAYAEAYAREALAAQAASVEPVELWQGRCVYPGGFAGEWKEIHPTKYEPTQELRAAYLASLTHPSGEPSYEIRKLYASAPPSPASVPDDGWLIDGGLLYRLTDESKPQNRDEINITQADGSRTNEARNRRARELLGRIRSTAQHPIPSPATSVDAVAELREALRMGVECLQNFKILHPEDFDLLDERAIWLMKTALKTALATKEPK